MAWFISELERLVAAGIGRPSLLADLGILGFVAAAVGMFVAAARHRLRPADEAGLYLDAIAIFGATTGAVIVAGAGLVTDPTAAGLLVNAAFLLAIMGSTLLLNVTTRAPLRFVGQWEMLAALALGGAAHLGLLLPAVEGVARTGLHAVIAGAVVLGGHGGLAVDERGGSGASLPGRRGWLRGALPVASVIVTGGLIIVLVTTPWMVAEPMRIAAAAALTMVVVCAVARQTLLLRDRERVLWRERQLTDELTVAEAQYRSVVERVPGVVYVAEAGEHGRWHFVSPKITELLGYTPEEWMADPTLWFSRIHPADRERMLLAELDEAGRTEAKGRWEYRLLARDGRVVWVIDDEAVIARDADGRPTMVQGILVDIGDRKTLEEQLRHQALHDALTGLPNRVLFVDRLAHALVRRNQVAGIAVLFVDLDDFKGVNDSHGHVAGDELLRMVAHRLAGVLRTEDTACRIGGDEFAFLLEDADWEGAEIVARRILEALDRPFALGNGSITLSASIGVATHARHLDGEAVEAADEMLRDADTAMYVAKSRGKGLVGVFERGMEAPIARRRELGPELERALETDELFLEYQPIVELRRARVVGTEALVRWNHPVYGRLMPSDFVTTAEEGGLIRRLGEWVLRRACTDYGRAVGLGVGQRLGPPAGRRVAAAAPRRRAGQQRAPRPASCSS